MRNRKPLQLNEMSQHNETVAKLRAALQPQSADTAGTARKSDWTKTFIASGGKPGGKTM